jgi:hypothetical protein
MIGYHYTSYKNWLKIKKEGLIPYKIKNDGLKNIWYLKRPVYGIWLWKRNFKGISKMGTLLDRVFRLRETRIVVLKVSYQKKYTWKAVDGNSIVATHLGQIDGWKYHKARSTVITVWIPPKNIIKIGDYDFLKFTT